MTPFPLNHYTKNKCGFRVFLQPQRLHQRQAKGARLFADAKIVNLLTVRWMNLLNEAATRQQEPHIPTKLLITHLGLIIHRSLA